MMKRNEEFGEFEEYLRKEKKSSVLEWISIVTRGNWALFFVWGIEKRQK